MVRPEGFEPPTLWFEAKYSIQLNYGRTASEPINDSPQRQDLGLRNALQKGTPYPFICRLEGALI